MADLVGIGISEAAVKDDKKMTTDKDRADKSYLDGPDGNIVYLINWIDLQIGSKKFGTGAVYVLRAGVLWRQLDDLIIEMFISFENISAHRISKTEELNPEHPLEFVFILTNGPIIENVISYPALFPGLKLEEKIREMNLNDVSNLDQAGAAVDENEVLEIRLTPTLESNVRQLNWMIQKYSNLYFAWKDVPTEDDLTAPGTFDDADAEPKSEEERKKEQEEYDARVKKYGHVVFKSPFGMRVHQPRVYSEWRKPIERDGVKRMEQFWRNIEPGHWMAPIERNDEFQDTAMFADSLADQTK